MFFFALLSFLFISCDLTDSEPDESIPAIPYAGITFSWSQEVIPSFSAGDTAIVKCHVTVDSLSQLLDYFDRHGTYNDSSGRERCPEMFELLEECHTSHDVRLEIKEVNERFFTFVGPNVFTIPAGEASGNTTTLEVRFTSSEYTVARTLSAAFVFTPVDSTDFWFLRSGSVFDAQMNP